MDTGVAGAGDWLQEEGARSDGTSSHGDATPGWPPLLAWQPRALAQRWDGALIPEIPFKR